MAGVEPTCGEFTMRIMALSAQLEAHRFRRYSRGWFKGYIVVPVGMWGKMLKRVNPSVKKPSL